MTDVNEYTIDWTVAITEQDAGFVWSAEGKPSTDRRKKVKEEGTQVFSDRMSAVANARAVLEQKTQALRQSAQYDDLEEVEFTL